MTKIEKPIIYQKTTSDITVSVSPYFLEEQSLSKNCLYVWAYLIRIDNFSSKEIQLIERHWEITDETGFTQVINGKGIIGEQPFILPGKSYEYASGTPLSTPSGIMVGYFNMKFQDGQLFKVAIPAFSLDSRYMKKTLN